MFDALRSAAKFIEIGKCTQKKHHRILAHALGLSRKHLTAVEYIHLFDIISRAVNQNRPWDMKFCSKEMDTSKSRY